MLTGRFAVEPKHTTGVLTLFRFRVSTVQPDIFSSLRCDQPSMHRALLLTPSPKVYSSSRPSKLQIV